VRTEDDARDLAQETLLRVFQRMSRGEALDSAEAYALGVGKNVFLEYCRRMQKAATHDGITGAVQLAGGADPLSDALVSSRALRFPQGSLASSRTDARAPRPPLRRGGPVPHDRARGGDLHGRRRHARLPCKARAQEAMASGNPAPPPDSDDRGSA